MAAEENLRPNRPRQHRQPDDAGKNLVADSMHLAILNLEKAQRRAKCTLIGHAIFVFLCCFAALMLRKLLRLPPQLAWTVFAVPLVVFSGDIARWMWRTRQLNRLRAKVSSK